MQICRSGGESYGGLLVRGTTPKGNLFPHEVVALAGDTLAGGGKEFWGEIGRVGPKEPLRDWDLRGEKLSTVKTIGESWGKKMWDLRESLGKRRSQFLSNSTRRQRCREGLAGRIFQDYKGLKRKRGEGLGRERAPPWKKGG